MLTRLYVEALLTDSKLADQAWEAWDKGEIGDLSACAAWLIVALSCNSSNPLWPQCGATNRYPRKKPRRSGAY